MGEVELLDLYWTSAGPVDVHVGREWSTFAWSDRCAQAARVGFREDIKRVPLFGLSASADSACGTPTSSTSSRRPRCPR